MSATEATTLEVNRREPEGSRSTRRLRRSGLVPGVVYGGDQEPIPFSVNERILRHALAEAGAVVELRIDGESSTPVVLKELVRHAVDGHTVHIDLLRVDLAQTIQATVTVELIGEDVSPGVKRGGVLEHAIRELNIEALPGDLPDVVQHDISAMEIGDSLLAGGVTLPAEIKLLDDPELMVATVSAPRVSSGDEDEIEQETGLVSDGGSASSDAGDGGAAGEGGQE